MNGAASLSRSATDDVRAARRPADAGVGAGNTLADAYAECERIARASSSSFTVAFHLLPPERRSALAALYAYCRVVDDAVDESDHPATALAAWRRELARMQEGTPEHPVAVALADASRRFAIPFRHLEEILTGMEMDVSPRTYETFEELRRYCYHAAAAVGLATLPIFGCRDVESRAYAEALGIALQLTNILRDVAEDAERGRIYVPREELRRFGYSERDLRTSVRNDAFRALVAFQVGRARDFYRAARQRIVARDRRALVAAEAMRLVYQRLLARIASDPDAIFAGRVRVPVAEKVLCVAAAWLRSRSAR